MVRSPRVQLQKAEKLVGKGKLEAALKIYENVLQEEQNDSGTLNKAGDLYVRLHRIDKAIELFSRTAGFFIEEQFFVKAIAIYKKILRLDPTRLDIGRKLADIYVTQGLVNDARSQYGEVADQYMKQGDVETALAVHHTMVGALPSDPSVRLRYAELLEEHNKLKESMSQYRQLARVLLKEGGTDEAAKVLMRGVEVVPEKLEYIEEAARDLWESGAKEAARSFLTRAAEHNAGAKDVVLEGAGKDSGSGQARALTDKSDTIVDPISSIGSATASQDSTAGEDSDDLVFELDMTDLETEFSVEAPTLIPSPGPALVDAGSKLAEIVQKPATKPDPDAPDRVLSDREKRVAELINEADVLIRFGMDEKATERLELALLEDSTHLGTYERLIDSYLRLSQMDKVPSLANRMSVAANEKDSPKDFEVVLARILGAGFKFEDGEFISPPSDRDEVGESRRDADRSIDEVVNELVVQLTSEQEPSGDQHTISEDLSGVTWLGEESLVEAVSAEVDLVLPTEEVATPVSEAEVDLALPTDDSEAADIDLAPASEQSSKPHSELIDIAEELMRELDDEDKRQESKELKEIEEKDDRLAATVATEEESLEDIVRGFREGVDATLSPEDYDTHFNLGIA
ncbi:MAG: tetratricopeptide repeat protein, partial [Thermoanaerobaculia bacterium]